MTGMLFADAKRGINGATPAERLHLLNHGLFQMILEYNFGQKRAKITRKNVKKMFTTTHDNDENQEEGKTDDNEGDENVQEEDTSVYGGPSDIEESPSMNANVSMLPFTGDEFSNVALFTKSICDKFDQDAKIYGRILQKQSSR
jgi:hypothetical protein